MPLPECKNPTSHAFIVGRGSEARHGRKDGQTDRQTDRHRASFYNAEHGHVLLWASTCYWQWWWRYIWMMIMPMCKNSHRLSLSRLVLMAALCRRDAIKVGFMQRLQRTVRSSSVDLVVEQAARCIDWSAGESRMAAALWDRATVRRC